MAPVNGDDPEVAAFLEALVVVNEGRTWSRKNRVEKHWSIACPMCKAGNLNLFQSARNGHVQGKCDGLTCTMAFIE